MSKETALQIAMRITQRYANSLFDEHTARGRQFMQEMSECLEQEREQIKESYKAGFNLRDSFNWECDAPWDTEADLKHNEQEFEKYYIETYKGGEQ